jgi:hypothetical protein
VAVADGFDISMVYIRTAKEVESDGSEGALKICLDFPAGYIEDPIYIGTFIVWLFETIFGANVPVPVPNYLFRITSKNCETELTSAFYDYAQPNPYNASGIDATQFTGSGSLSASFQTNITTSGSSTTDTEPILQTVNNFSLVACLNPVVPSPFLDPNEPDYQEAGSLVSPFFYKDTAHPSTNKEHTFFVQPSLTEKTVVEWEGWAIPPSNPVGVVYYPGLVNEVDVAPQYPTVGPEPVDPTDPDYSRYTMQSQPDWVANPATLVTYGNVAVGKTGGVNLGTNAVSNSSAVSRTAGALAAVGLTKTTGQLQTGLASSGVAALVSSRGLNMSQLRSIKALQTPTSSIAKTAPATRAQNS